MESVSVVIPTYNRATLAEATVRSMLAQTHAPMEILVVDDGSTDDTQAVCARFPEPVRYIKQANTGLPGARNRGIREARGEWVALCDSDDLWHPRKLETQLAALRASANAEWSITGCTLIDPDGKSVEKPLSGFEYVFPVFRAKGVSPERHFSRSLHAGEVEVHGTSHTFFCGDAYGLLFDGNFALPSSGLIARTLLEKAGTFDESFRYAEETEFFHRMAAASPVVIVTEPLVEYRIGHSSMISTGDATGFIHFALQSLDQAAQLRPVLAEWERAAYYAGRRALQLRLAYSRLSVLDRTGARKALHDCWTQSRDISGPFLGIFMASLLPSPVLRGLHRAKRWALS